MLFERLLYNFFQWYLSNTLFILFTQDRNVTSNKEFLTASRSLQLFPVAMSLLASFQSSVTILGYPAEMFLRGTQFWAVILSGILAAVVAAEVFLPVYYQLSFTSINKVNSIECKLTPNYKCMFVYLRESNQVISFIRDVQYHSFQFWLICIRFQFVCHSWKKT